VATGPRPASAAPSMQLDGPASETSVRHHIIGSKNEIEPLSYKNEDECEYHCSLQGSIMFIHLYRRRHGIMLSYLPKVSTPLNLFRLMIIT
jgi:hypothetical protein